MKIRKIVFLHVSFPEGGAERITLDIANYISSYNYEVYIFTCKLNMSRLALGAMNNITNIKLPDSQDINSMINADFMVDTIKDLSIDIFILPHCKLTSLQHIKSKVNCKIVFSHHGVPLWEVEDQLSIKKRKGTRTLLKALEWFIIRYPKYKLLKGYDKEYTKLYKKIYEQVDAYTVLCEEYKQTLVKKLRLDPLDNKIKVIHNPEKQIEKINLNKEKQLIYVGRMTYADKRIDRLIDIWGMLYNKLPEWELILIGDGSEKENLQKRVKEMGLKRIKFTGYTHNVQEHYRDASVLCLTSTFEGWGLCLTEAQANGVIPIAFGCSAGVKEILSPSGVNGFIVPPFHLKKYAKTLLMLLNNPQKLKEMQHNVITKSKKYSISAVGENWINLFNGLLAKDSE